MPDPQREILCYPITSVTRPIDLFGAFPRAQQLFMPSGPPAPPHRHSSKDNNTLKIISQIHTGSRGSNDEKPIINTGTITLRKSRLPCSIRSKSMGSLTTSITSLKEEKNLTNNSRITRHITHRVSSVSPLGRSADARKSSASPIAFGRSISKERTFAEEKKKAEKNLPPCRKSLSASTNILRDPRVCSPDHVRVAVRSSYRSPSIAERIAAARTPRRTGSNGAIVKTTTTSSALNRSGRVTPKTETKAVHASRVTISGGTGVKPSTLRSRNGIRTVTPVVIKSTSLRASRSTEPRSVRSKLSSKSTSNASLARTNSTFSIDSTNSKKRVSSKPLTITRSVSRRRDYSATLPSTITGESKKKKADAKPQANILSKGKTRTTSYSQSNANGVDEIKFTSTLRDEFQESINECILDRNYPGRSENFFQNLFLRDLSPQQIHSLTTYDGPRTAVQQQALLWDTWPRSRAVSPHTQHIPHVYLSQKRAVSGSKFKTMENERLRQSRSLSPLRIVRGLRRPHHVSKYDIVYQLSDEEPDFGNDAEQTTSLNIRYEERSRSEPRSRTYMHESRSENGITTISGSTRRCGRSEDRPDHADRPFTPTKEIRSPSCRRIQSFKSAKAPARSHSMKAPQRYHSLDSRLRSRSACAYDGEKYESHSEVCTHLRPDKFKELNNFYTNVERVGQLERATSSTDIRPIRREDELIDFDVWKQVRGHERAKCELHSLVDKLKKEEKEKDFVFRAKYAEDLKWDQNADRGLRIKEKSVENLKELFLQKAQQLDLDREAREQIKASKDNYKPLWRGNSVLDLASNMVTKYNPESSRVQRHSSLKDSHERRLGLSTNLISTLSKDQVNKIKNQLSEIYCNKTAQKQEEFIINVTEERSVTATPSLMVRSQSLVNAEDLLNPVLRRQHARIQNNNLKAESTGNVQESRASRSVDRVDSRPKQPSLTEDEKKKLLSQLGQEIREKVQERREKIVQPKETRGAIASGTPSPRSKGTPKENITTTTKTVHFLDKKVAKNILPQARITIEVTCEAKTKKKKEPATSQKQVHQQQDQPDSLISLDENIVNAESSQPTAGKSDADVKDKIDYFEKKKDEEPEKVIYHAREDSSPDEDEVIRAVEENMRQRKKERKAKETACLASQGRSSSASDFKELFGEKEVTRNLIEFRSPSPERHVTRAQTSSPKDISNSTSVESIFRSRSISPIVYDARTFRPHPKHPNTGDVDKIKNKFESLTYRPIRYNAAAVQLSPRRYRSDPDLNKVTRHISPNKVLVKHHEAGDVSWITHKFETKNKASRSRCRDRKVISPIPRMPLKDRFMPHIDIISKTASLKREISCKSPINQPPTAATASDAAAAAAAVVTTGEVEKIRHKFESLSPDRLSLVGQMYTSSPDIRELKDITNHLTASWVAHKYPKPDSGPDGGKIKKRSTHRPSSASPPRSRDLTSWLKPFYNIFSDDEYDPKKHRPTHRYIPDKSATNKKSIEAEYLWRRIKRQASASPSKPTVKFEGGIFHLFILRTIEEH